MADKNKEYESALGSIYDFIFNEIEKEPSKRKPLTPTGVDNSSELVNALADIMAMPGVFVNKETMGAIDALGNVEIFKNNVGTRQTDSLKILAKDIPDLLRDPRKWVDKKFATMEMLRKQSRVAWAGEFMMGVNAGALARKNGLDKETVVAMTSSSRSGTTRGDYMQTSMWKRNEKLIQKYQNKSLTDITAEFSNFYEDNVAKKKARELKSKIDGKDWQKLDTFQLLELLDINDKAKSSRNAASIANTDKERNRLNKAANDYQNMGNILVTMNGLQENNLGFRHFDKNLNKINQDRKLLQKRISEGRKNGLSNEDIKILKKNKKVLDDSYQTLQQYKFFSNVGRVEGIYQTLKGYWQGGLVPALITLDFYDDKKNKIKYLLPTEGKKIELKGLTSEFVIAKYNKGRVLSNSYYKTMEKAYYLSPVQIAKNFFYDGSTYAFKRYRNLEKFGKELFNEKVFNKYEALVLQSMKIKTAELDSLYKRFLNLNPEELQDLLSKLGANDEFKKEFNKFLKRNDKLTKQLKLHGSLAKMQQKIQGYFVKRTRFIRSGISTFLGAFGVKSSVMENWVVNGGFGVVAREVIEHALLSILKIFGTSTLGPIGNIIADFAVSLVAKIAKPLTQTLIVGAKYVLIIIFSFVFIIIFLIISFFLPNTSEYAYVAPDQINYCEAYVPSKVLVTDFGNPNVVYDGSIQEIYEQVQKELGVSTGLQLVTCPDVPTPEDYACAKIDWAWCYSGSSVFCRIDKLSGQSAETLTKLFRHELLHQIQATGGGGASSTFREWGADYLSSNGGGYTFSVNTGEVLRATEIGSRLISNGVCTHNLLTSIARNEAGSLQTSCGIVLQNTIKAKLH